VASARALAPRQIAAAGLACSLRLIRPAPHRCHRQLLLDPIHAIVGPSVAVVDTIGIAAEEHDALRYLIVGQRGRSRRRLVAENCCVHIHHLAPGWESKNYSIRSIPTTGRRRNRRKQLNPGHSVPAARSIPASEQTRD